MRNQDSSNIQLCVVFVHFRQMKSLAQSIVKILKAFYNFGIHSVQHLTYLPA